MEKFKKLLSILLSVVLVLTCFPINGLQKVVRAEDNYTPITCIDDLALIRSNPEGNYILTADLDLTEATAEGGYLDQGYGWVPISTFKGKFDGNGHYIKGLTIYGKPSVSSLGLFGSTEGAEIKNLNMMDVNIDVDSNGYIGGIVGYSHGYDSISNCIVSGKIYDKSLYNIPSVGGILGNAQGYEIDISNCINSADIESNGYIGGILGYSDYYPNIKSSYNIGQCDLAISGYYKCYVSNCYYLTGSATLGMRGYDDSTGTVMPLSDNAMKNANYFVGFDFNSVWEMDPYCTYKYPQLKSNRIVRVAGIELVSNPNKTVYYQGDTLDLSGATMKITYEGTLAAPTTVLLTNDYVDSNSYNMANVGSQNVVINFGGKQLSIPITVKPIEVDSVALSNSTINLEKGYSYTLTSAVYPENATDKSVTYTSSDTSVAVVDNSGVVTGVSSGTAQITATSANGKTAVCQVNVVITATTIILSNTSIEMNKGEIKSIQAVISPIDTTDSLTWASSNPTIASVDIGAITALSPGTTEISVMANQNVIARCNVSVYASIENFSIIGLENTRYTGDEIKPDIQVSDGTSILTKNVDYSVEYSDNIEIGTASVIVNGIGFYKGTIVGTFNISSVKYVVKFIDRGQVVKSEEVSEGNSAHAPKLFRKGYLFNGWTKAFNNVTENIVTVAKWKKIPEISRTSITKIIANKNNSKSAIVNVKKIKGVSGYQIRYSNKKNMKKYKTVATSGTRKTISKISSKDRILYVQVRGYRRYSDGQIAYGKWSKIYSFKWKK